MGCEDGLMMDEDRKGFPSGVFGASKPSECPFSDLGNAPFYVAAIIKYNDC
jgi:hypothetical protein